MNSYPLQVNKPVRRGTVAVKSRYGLYKAELREDFTSRCGYCDTLDFYSGGRRGFHIDHFAPKSKFEALKNEYTNLVYACPICNIAKSDDWPTEDSSISFRDDVGYIDPCDSQYELHLVREKDGSIRALTPLGTYIHKRLKFNLRRRQICWLLERMEGQLVQLAKLVDSDSSKTEEVKLLCCLTTEYFRYLGVLKSE